MIKIVDDKDIIYYNLFNNVFYNYKDDMSLKIKNSLLVLVVCFILEIAMLPSITFGFGVPSVSLCIKKLGLTEKECQEKMKNFTGSSEQKTKMKNEVIDNKAKDDSNTVSLENSIDKNKYDIIDTRVKKAQRIKSEKIDQFSRILRKVEDVVDFLEFKSVDVSSIGRDIVIFKEMSSDIVSAYDKYIILLKEERNNEMVSADVMQEARMMISSSMSDLIKFSRMTLQENLKFKVMNISSN